ncbi:hypothetical protein HK097_006395 [Rhizophlyctis rosea]|uniref:DUF6697 domain-containing protein n=1 Tax=Rhizophlyctis rosea TaxID=64517 RepID=A0AAD5X6Q4_9FUNG|nr:hypothetical protein HK097_006395 [Rhizophlyctis rosea]
MYCRIRHDLKNPNDLFPLFIHPDDGVAGYFYLGHYQCIKDGHLPKQVFEKAPPARQDLWIKGILGQKWGKRVMDQAGLDENAGYNGIKAALLDGRIKLTFAVMEYNLYDQILVNKLSAVPKKGYSPKQKDEMRNAAGRATLEGTGQVTMARNSRKPAAKKKKNVP